jgi:hypothetical protein
MPVFLDQMRQASPWVAQLLQAYSEPMMMEEAQLRRPPLDTSSDTSSDTGAVGGGGGGGGGGGIARLRDIGLLGPIRTSDAIHAGIDFHVIISDVLMMPCCLRTN